MTNLMDRIPYLRKSTVFIIFVIALLLRLYALQAVPLIEDEKDISVRITEIIRIDKNQINLPFGSFLTKHPLLCSYVAKLGIVTFGYNKWGIRLPFILLGIVGMFFAYLLTKCEFGEQKARLVLILLALSQYHIGISRIATTQSLTLFFIPLILYVFYKLLQSKRKQYIVFLAVLLGLGYLTKTTMLLFIPIFLLFFLFSRKHRVLLRQKTWLLGLMVMLIIISPSIYWNFTNDFTDLRNTLTDIGGIGFSLRSFALYLGELSPLVWDYSTIDRVCSTEYPFMHWIMGLLALIAIIYSFRLRETDLGKLLLITFGLVFVVCSFMKGPPGNMFLDSSWWAQMSFIPGMIFSAHMLVELSRKYIIARYCIYSLILYFIIHAIYFVTIDKNYFVPFY